MNTKDFNTKFQPPSRMAIDTEDYNAMKAIITELATESLVYGSEVDSSACCHFCNGVSDYGNPETAIDFFKHEPDCLILKIRALASKLNT